jgi:hypothetical protein
VVRERRITKVTKNGRERDESEDKGRWLVVTTGANRRFIGPL